MQFYLFNIYPNLHRRKRRKLRVKCSELSQVHQQPAEAVVRPTFIRKLCYKLPSVVAVTFIKTYDQNFVFFTERRRIDSQCDA